MNVTQATYHGEGPVLPGESDHQALGENTVYSLAGHLLKSPAPGHGFEDEPADAAEKASQQTAQKAARSASQALLDGTQDGAPVFSFSDTADQVRSATRPGVK